MVRQAPSLPAGLAAQPAPPTWAVAHQPNPYGRRVVTDQRPVHGAIVATAWVSAVLTLGYMLPWAIAATRGRSNQAAIGLINFFLGWSLIGWIVAMVMACQAHQVVSGGATTVVVAQQFSSGHQTVAPAGWYPVATGGRRYWDGAAWTDHQVP